MQATEIDNNRYDTAENKTQDELWTCIMNGRQVHLLFSHRMLFLIPNVSSLPPTSKPFCHRKRHTLPRFRRCRNPPEYIVFFPPIHFVIVISIRPKKLILFLPPFISASVVHAASQGKRATSGKKKAGCWKCGRTRKVECEYYKWHPKTSWKT